MKRRLLALLIALSATGCLDGYDIYLVEYAHSTDVPAERLIAGAEGELVDMSWHFVVAVGTGRTAGRVLLVDAGTTYFEVEDPEVNFFKNYWKVDSHRPVADALAPLGIAPEDVSDILVTHWHFDHFEGIREFPDAHVWLPAAEWDDARAAYASDIPTQLGWVPSLVPTLDALEASGRLHRFDPADAELALGLYPMWQHIDSSITEAGKHTNHSSVIGLHCASGQLFHVAMDAAYTYRNLEEEVAVGLAADPVANVEDMRRLKALAGGIDRILPGHDPEVFARFPSVAPGVARVCP